MKQYVIKNAYTDNYHVLQYVDGKLEEHRIVSYYELDRYIAYLKNKGYNQAYYEQEYKIRMLEAKEQYEFARDDYEQACKNPIILSETEIRRYKQITQ